MKKWIMLLGMIASAHASTQFEACHYDKQEMSAVVCYGPAELNGTVVKGDVKVVGALTANDISAGSITVSGSAELKNVHVNGAVNIEGFLHAHNTEFNQSISIAAADVILNHSTVRGAITINEAKDRPTVQIQCGSIIAGSISFVGLAGTVQVAGDSIVQGNVNNGTIEFVDRECD